MPKLIIDNVEYEISEGSFLEETCEEAGIPFSCNSGVCGTCQIEILEGKENLSPVNQEEDDLGMDENNRLACQCKILQGTVKITY